MLVPSFRIRLRFELLIIPILLSAIQNNTHRELL
jgi:hypothetical protein